MVMLELHCLTENLRPDASTRNQDTFVRLSGRGDAYVPSRYG